MLLGCIYSLPLLALPNFIPSLATRWHPVPSGTPCPYGRLCLPLQTALLSPPPRLTLQPHQISTPDLLSHLLVLLGAVSSASILSHPTFHPAIATHPSKPKLNGVPVKLSFTLSGNLFLRSLFFQSILFLSLVLVFIAMHCINLLTCLPLSIREASAWTVHYLHTNSHAWKYVALTNMCARVV